MADSWSTVRYSEVLPLNSGKFTPDIGTETIVSVKVTLRDNLGVVAGGLDATAIVQGTTGGWVVAASTTPFAWWFWSAIALNLPTPTAPDGDKYTLEFLAVDGASPAGSYESVIGLVLQRDGS